MGPSLRRASAWPCQRRQREGRSASSPKMAPASFGLRCSVVARKPARGGPAGSPAEGLPGLPGTVASYRPRTIWKWPCRRQQHPSASQFKRGPYATKQEVHRGPPRNTLGGPFPYIPTIRSSNPSPSVSPSPTTKPPTSPKSELVSSSYMIASASPTSWVPVTGP